jgi:hypothetical protein
MKKWEYLVVKFQGGNTWMEGENEVKGSSHQIDGQDINVYLNKLGEEGWELITAESLVRFVLKRPKPVG